MGDSLSELYPLLVTVNLKVCLTFSRCTMPSCGLAVHNEQSVNTIENFRSRGQHQC